MPALPISGVKLVVEGFESFIKKTNQASKAAADIGSGAGVASKSLGGAGKSMAIMAAAGTAAAFAIRGLGRSLANANRDLVEFASSSFLTAARVEELYFILQALAGNAGLAIDPIREQIKAIKSLGIRSKDAQELIANMIRFQIDLADATELARAAQDFATIAQKDSSETLSNLTQGIVRLESRMIRTSGATIDLNEAYRKQAQILGKTTDALSIYEKRQAAVDAVIENATTVAGAYSAAMQTVGKRIRSLPRLFADLQENLGTPFLAGGASFVGSLNNMIKVFIGASAEGGKLNKVLFKLGAAFSVVGDEIESQSIKIANSIVDMLADTGNQFIRVGQKAFEWGVELIAQFAKGMAQGVAGTLTVVMNAITKLLTFWLAPGSPPRVAPDIDKWGIRTMTEYLKGFALADFSVLSDIQKPLQSALTFLVKEGLVSSGDATSTFREITKNISKSISETGRISSSVFNQIARSAGVFGTEIAQLARSLDSLAMATEAVNKANEDFLSASDKVEKQQQLVSKLVREFNELRRGGASKELLAVRRDELEAAEAGLFASRDDLVLAEEKKIQEEERLAVVKDQASAQKQLVDQLLSLSKITIGAGGLGGVGKDLEEILDGLGGLGADIDTTLDAAFEGAKEKIRLAISDALEPLRKVLRDLVSPPDGVLFKFKEAWEDLKDAIGGFVEFIRGEGVNPLMKQIADNVVFMTGAVLGLAIVFGILVAPFLIISALFGTVVLAIAGVIIGLALLKTAFIDNKTTTIETLIGIVEAFFVFTAELNKITANVLNAIGEFIIGVVNLIITGVEDAVNAVIDVLNIFVQDSVKVVNDIRKAFGKDPIEIGLIGNVSFGRAEFGEMIPRSLDDLLEGSSALEFLNAELSKSVIQDIIAAGQGGTTDVLRSQQQLEQTMLRNERLGGDNFGEVDTFRAARSSEINYNFDIEAIYPDRQTPETIANDLQAILMLAQGQ